MKYTLSFTFCKTFKIPIEVGASFTIEDALVFITAVDEVAELVGYAVVERQGE